MGYRCVGVVVMIDVTVKHTEPMSVAFIRMHGAYMQIPQSFQTLYRYTAEQNLMPIGAPHAVYLTPPGESLETDADWELWAPVANPVAELGPDEHGLGMKHVGGRLVASAMHRGPYEDIEPTYRALEAWIAGHGYAMSGPPEEIYFSDPNEVPPEEYVTEIQFPVAEA
jgi:AraC family transcriptional regulator